MSWLKIISDAVAGHKQQAVSSSRESAKQRLSVLLINDRAGRGAPDFMPRLRQDIVAVLKKYVPVAAEEDVEVKISKNENEDVSLMELTVTLDRLDAHQNGDAVQSRT